MDRAIYQNEYKEQQYRGRVWMLVALVSLFINAGLVVYQIVDREYERYTIVPPEIDRPFNAKGDWYSDSYYEQVAQYFASMVLNYTPDTYEHGAQTFLKLVHPSQQGVMKSRLIEERQYVIDKGISSFFTIKLIETKGKSAVLTGQLKRWIGNELLEEKQKKYLLSFSTDKSGRVFIVEFKEVAVESASSF